NAGLKPTDVGYVQWLKSEGYKTVEDFLNYEDKESIYINQQLEGVLDCSEYKKLYGIYISAQVDETKLVFKNLPEKEQIIKLHISSKNLQGELDLSDFVNLKVLDCRDEKLTSLNLSNCSQLEKIYCSDNLLTNLALPTNPTNLKGLYLENNNFPEQDLSFLVPYSNLEEINYLSGMKKLKSLCIRDTDINKVNIEKLPRSLEGIYFDADKKLNRKLTEIISELDKNEEVVLKSLTSSQNITLEFLTEITNTKLVIGGNGEYSNIVDCYGISQNPETKNYLIVMRYIERGNLREYLKDNSNKLNLVGKLSKLGEMDDTELVLRVCQGYRPDIDKRPSAEELWRTSWETKDKELEQKYNAFSQNTPYQIHSTATTTSKMIDTNEITQRLQRLKTKEYHIGDTEKLIVDEFSTTTTSLIRQFKRQLSLDTQSKTNQGESKEIKLEQEELMEIDERQETSLQPQIQIPPK
ncbi:32746_t:CDS:2, partial [Gigaspora margarita]